MFKVGKGDKMYVSGVHMRSVTTVILQLDPSKRFPPKLDQRPLGE